MLRETRFLSFLKIRSRADDMAGRISTGVSFHSLAAIGREPNCVGLVEIKGRGAEAV
jgi:hypothetical protein